MNHRLFDQAMLPHFTNINIAEIEPTIREVLATHRAKISALLSQNEPYTWDNLMQPLEQLSDELNKQFAPIGHLHAVLESDALRRAYNQILPLIIAYQTELSQNEKLYHAVSTIAASPNFTALNTAQRKIIENDIRDFKLSGIHLPADKKAELAELQQQLGQLTTKFSENLLDATNAWILHLNDEEAIEGLPPQAKQLAIDNAKQRNLAGYVITLEYPSYSTAIKFLKNRKLRKVIYEAYCTRASEIGPNAERWDNSSIMQKILHVRQQIAQLVGFSTYAHYSLATKMAKTPDDVLHFLHDLLTRSKPIAEKEYQELIDEAAGDNVTDLAAWDLAYYSEQLQMTKFDFTQEDFRPYFPIQKVLDGLFNLVNQLYGITIQEQKNIEVWHPDVRFFTLHDEHQALRGGFYIDLYARPHKRDGAWMDDCRTRFRLAENNIQHPVAFLTCNFMPPTANEPALLTHDDVLTLFHEFGHSLHHMLTQVDYPSVAGINGVPWDAVEFPSQFMENFCWEKDVLALISGHYQTGAALPDALYDKLIAAKYFQSSLQMLRQLEFALFDFRLHLEFDPAQTTQIQTLLNDVRRQTSVAPIPSFNRFQNSFAHIFAGGYAAGYYSYKWAEVLSADAYAKFEENHIFNHTIGLSFMHHILEIGGVLDPMNAFIAFRGREPNIDALLRQNGIK